MHVPDGFINAPVSAAAGVAAAAAVAVSLRGARKELGGHPRAEDLGGDRLAPLAGLVAAFVFAVQMLNFPVAAGTSGHLLGGALAAILVGPWTGVLCIAVVLLMQGVLFADGGLTALGVNITVMGVVTVVTAHLLFRGLRLVLPRTRGGVTAATFVAALVSVPASAAAFTLIYAIGGTTDVPIGKVLTAMLGVHVLIGIGEAVITALTVGAVLAVRPDLVHGARGLTAPLKLRVDGELVDAPKLRADGELVDAPKLRADGELVDAPPAPAGTPAPAGAPATRSPRKFWIGGVVTALVLAGVVSFYASASPDGLEKVAADQGIDAKAEEYEHATADSPLADYGVKGVESARLSGGLAGVIGVGLTLAVGTGAFWAARRRGRAADTGARV
ncbi:energy-coupling factor ABC transporter permease [Streptomyces roseolus]|uniref:energy-coupling factor ABC transporter permease n=1 Tax=Streptomyces roseolus TaxID=67358 RepID=UPI00167A34A0|nr:energy-coupling factor ABC transporter permease [Streptomyces roseolus]GGR49055.1 hypothetical protein GCM10010282_47360 [Streptomyces roseolus]